MEIIKENPFESASESQEIYEPAKIDNYELIAFDRKLPPVNDNESVEPEDEA